MNSTHHNHITNQKLKDGKFNVEEIQHYNLSLHVGTQDFQVAVIDSRNNRCLILEDYQFSEAENLLDNLQIIFDEHHFLKAGFWTSVKIAFKNNCFSIIPSTLFDKSNLDPYLQINANTSTEHTTLYYKHDALKAVVVFSVETALTSFFTVAYPGTTVHFLHQTSILIEGLRKYEDYSFQKNMVFSVEEGAISIFVYQEAHLIYCNRFLYHSHEKMMEYVMMVMQEMDLDQYETKVMVWGDISSNSQAFDKLQTYIYNISFGGKLPLLTYSYVFDEIEDHNYFDLFSIYLCD